MILTFLVLFSFLLCGIHFLLCVLKEACVDLTNSIVITKGKVILVVF